MPMPSSKDDDAAPKGRAEGLSISSRAEIALHGIYEISKILAVPGRLETSLSNVLTVLSSFLEMRHGMIALLDDKGAPTSVVGVGWSEGLAKSHFEMLPERAVGQVVTTKMPVVVEDVAHHPLFAEWPDSEGNARDGHANGEAARVSFIGVPIKERDKVIGALTIDRVWDGHSQFRFDDDVRFLVMIANLVGQTVRLYDVVVRDRERLMDEQRRLAKELPRSQPKGDQALTGIVGASRAIRSVFDMINVVARTHTTVLLRGESGTGKELFARATHDLSPRNKGPFIKLNCAALPETMLETELFGHEKGSFTGAIGQRKGRFELADKGTLFLDEIGEISPAFQAKLLRVLQEGEFERVGGMRTVKVDVRFVFATNKNLEEAVSRGEFRADLYYRINVVSIQLPPLRERPDDVVLLAREFLYRFNAENGTKHQLTSEALTVLEGCYFPGNVRELENCVRRTATLAKSETILDSDFACRNDTCLSSTLWKGLIPTTEPFRIRPVKMPAAAQSVPTAPAMPPAIAPSAHDEAFSAPPTVARPTPAKAAPFVARDFNPPQVVSGDEISIEGSTERERLIQAMEKAGWVQAKAARLLNLTPRQIAYALSKHAIPVKKF